MRRLCRVLSVVLLLMALSPHAVSYAADVSPVHVYQDGRLMGSSEPDFSRDVKTLAPGSASNLFTNYPDGYSIEAPKLLQLDLRYSPSYVRLYSQDLDVKISREDSS